MTFKGAKNQVYGFSVCVWGGLCIAVLCSVKGTIGCSLRVPDR